MYRITAVTAVAVAAVAAALHAGPATAGGGGRSGTWPAGLPLPTAPGSVVAQSSSTAVIRSTDSVAVVRSKLDQLYVVQLGCTVRFAVNRPKDYVCLDPATGRSTEVYFTFAALDPTATDATRSQTNAFLVGG